MLQTRWWEPLTTCCSWINFFKSTFFNSLVLSKHSSRAGVRYVGPVTDTRVWRYTTLLQWGNTNDGWRVEIFPPGSSSACTSRVCWR